MAWFLWQVRGLKLREINPPKVTPLVVATESGIELVLDSRLSVLRAPHLYSYARIIIIIKAYLNFGFSLLRWLSAQPLCTLLMWRNCLRRSCTFPPGLIWKEKILFQIPSTMLLSQWIPKLTESGKGLGKTTLG